MRQAEFDCDETAFASAAVDDYLKSSTLGGNLAVAARVEAQMSDKSWLRGRVEKLVSHTTAATAIRRRAHAQTIGCPD